jgi:predicted lipid-binding transport protein (Tim44 family)
MAYQKKVTKKTKGSNTGGVLGGLVGGLAGTFLQGYATNLLGAQGGTTVTKKVIKKKK